MGEGAQQSYLSWQSTQRRYECSGKKGTGATRGLIPYHGEQVPIYSTNKRDTWRVRAASSSGKVCVMSLEYIHLHSERPSSGGSHGWEGSGFAGGKSDRTVWVTYIFVTPTMGLQKCEGCVCLFSIFFPQPPQHWQHLLGFSESTYSALLNSAESFSLSCSAMIVPGTRCD